MVKRRQVFILISIIHILLVFGDLIAFKYSQSSDAPRYIAAANDFSNLNFFNLTSGPHCVTAPGYPLFLAVIKPFTGHNKFLIGFIQAVLFSFSLFIVLRVLEKKEFISPKLTLIVFAVILFSPEVFKTNGVTLTESFTASLLLLSFGSLFNPKKNTWNNFLFISSFSFLALVKFEYLFLLPITLLFLFQSKRFKLSVSLIISILIILSLNGYKNFKTFGKFNPTSFGSGTVIYGGNNLNGDGSWHSTWDNQDYLPAENWQVYLQISSFDPKCSCIKMDSLYKAMAIDAWEKDWLFQLKIIPVKFGKLWILPAEMDFYTAQKEFKPGLQLNVLFDDNFWPWYGKYKHGVALVIYWIYLILIISGFIIKLRKQGLTKIDWFILYAFAGVSFLYSVPFYGLGRFHVPVFPLLAIYSVFSIIQIDDYFLKGRLKMLVEKLAK